MGDLADLARIGRFTRRLGGGVVMVNPMVAPTPVLPIEPSPYYPSSRRFANPLFLRVEEVPGWDRLDAGMRERLGNAGRALNGNRKIDRDAIFKLKTEALEAIFAGFEGQGGHEDGFDWFRRGKGQALTDFATYCALAELHGKDWRAWPEPLRRPDGEGVHAFRKANVARINFHSWLQWQLDTQLARASQTIAIINDLPIGLDVAGADAWCWQDLLARDVSVGAPPDEFNAAGQDWGLTPFIPHRLRAARYQPFIETIRGMLSHVGGLRIDHVMGLFRLFWIPRALGTKGGSYVRTRADELMAIVALESERARAFVIGEDLGTVEPGVRERLHDYRMMSYRLLYFEPAPPAALPGAGALQRHHPRSAHHRGPVDRVRRPGAKEARDRPQRGRDQIAARKAAQARQPRRERPRRGGDRIDLPRAGPGAVTRPSGHARRRGRHARAPQPAGDRQPVAQLVAGTGKAAGGDRRDGAPRPPRECPQKIEPGLIRDTMGG